MSRCEIEEFLGLITEPYPYYKGVAGRPRIIEVVVPRIYHLLDTIITYILFIDNHTV